MKILFDNQVFAMHDYGGVSRIFSELIPRIQKRANDCLLPFVISNNIYLNKIKQVCNLYYINYFKLSNHFQATSYLPQYLRKKKRTLLFLHNLLYLPINTVNYLSNILLLVFAKYDIYHPTYFNDSLLKYVNKSAKIVITIYDMIDEIFDRNPYNTKRKRALIQRADKIIAISERTKQDIIRLYKIPKHKISVSYLGTTLHEDFTNRSVVDFNIIANLPLKYILYIGTRDNYKNFKFFCTGFIHIIKKHTDIKIVCVGGGNLLPEEIGLLEKLNIQEKITVLHTNDSTLFEIYKKAQLLVYPSLYEGFGIPLLEAFSAGCPVASSDRGSLKEVGGEAVQYFNPENETSMIHAIDVILSDNKRRLKLIKLGLERVRKFSWDENTSQTLEIYKSVLKT